MPKHSVTRKNYERCYRAWRKGATHEVMEIWQSDRPIYRAAGDSFVGNISDLSGWVNLKRRWQFVVRLMDLQNAH